MGQLRMLIAGLVTVTLLIVLPLTMTGRSRSSDQLVQELLQIDQLQSSLKVEVLSLRIGRTKNYDALVQTMAELQERIDGILDRVDQSSEEEDRPIAERMRKIAASLEDIDPLVVRFPTFNASVANSVSAIEEDLERLDRGEFYEEAAPEEESLALQTLCHLALALQASWSDEKGQEFLEREHEALHPKVSAEMRQQTLLRHLELSVLHRLEADSILAELLSLLRSNDLRTDIQDHLARVAVADAEFGGHKLVVQSIAFTIAVAICILLCAGSWMQSRNLQHEVQ
ncbi:MAG: DAHL domain-containing protein, partial [Planctomycetota bacterium]